MPANTIKFLARNALATNFFIFKQPHINKHTLVQPSKSIHGKNFQICCTNLATPPFAAVSASFSKISIKCSKKSGMLATLVKFSQASDPHPPHQQKFVKMNTA